MGCRLPRDLSVTMTLWQVSKYYPYSLSDAGQAKNIQTGRQPAGSSRGHGCRPLGPIMPTRVAAAPEAAGVLNYPDPRKAMPPLLLHRRGHGAGRTLRRGTG